MTEWIVKIEWQELLPYAKRRSDDAVALVLSGVVTVNDACRTRRCYRETSSLVDLQLTLWTTHQENNKHGMRPTRPTVCSISLIYIAPYQQSISPYAKMDHWPILRNNFRFLVKQLCLLANVTLLYIYACIYHTKNSFCNHEMLKLKKTIFRNFWRRKNVWEWIITLDLNWLLKWWIEFSELMRDFILVIKRTSSVLLAQR